LATTSLKRWFASPDHGHWIKPVPSALVEACTGPSLNEPTVPSLEDMQAAAELRQAGRLH
jgi:hypothetical protein